MAIGRNYILLRDNRSGKIESTSRAISPYNIIGIMVCLYNANTPFVAALVIFLYPDYSTSRVFNHTRRWISLLPNLGAFLFARHRPLRSRQFYIVTNNHWTLFSFTLDIDLRRPWYRNKLRARKILNCLFVNFVLIHLLYYCFKFFVLIFPTFRYQYTASWTVQQING